MGRMRTGCICQKEFKDLYLKSRDQIPTTFRPFLHHVLMISRNGGVATSSNIASNLLRNTLLLPIVL